MKHLLILALLLGFAAGTQAQAPGSPGPAPQAATTVPLDGGASLLLAAGVAAGLRKLRKRRTA